MSGLLLENARKHPLFKLFIKVVSVLAAIAALWLLASVTGYAESKPTERTISFDFERVDIRNIIRLMAEATGENYIVDSQVSGNVTIMSPGKVNLTEAQKIFDHVLLASGYVVVPSGDVKQILPATQAKGAAGTFSFRAGTIDAAGSFQTGDASIHNASDVITRILKPQNVRVESLLPALKPLASSATVLVAYATNNMLLISDTAAHVARLESITNALDSSTPSGSVVMLPLQHADALHSAETLNRIFESRQTSHGLAKPTILPEPARNLLIISANAADMQEIRTVLTRLDTPNTHPVQALEIVYLKHANAEKMAGVLKTLVQENADNLQKKTTDTLLSAPTSKGMSADTHGAFTAFKNPVSVVAESSTNALVLSAAPHDMAVLKQIIEKLDIRRLQVYIEALVMEVSEDISNQFGVEWRSTENLKGGGTHAFGGLSFGESGINALADNPLAMPSGLAFGVAGANITFRGKEYANIGALVRALQSEREVNILSTPQLLTMDNEEAEIIVGENVPFLTGTYTVNNGNGNPFQTIERQDVGLNLVVKPQISENGYVRLNIFQEISSVAAAGDAVDIRTRKRSLRTAVVVPDGNMVSLGGLIREDHYGEVQQVPCLGGIFGFGELFKSTATQRNKTNLMVFIKPHIINAYGDLDTITHEKYVHMRTQQLDRSYKGSKLLPAFEPSEAEMVPQHLRYSRNQHDARQKAGAAEPLYEGRLIPLTKPLNDTPHE